MICWQRQQVLRTGAKKKLISLVVETQRKCGALVEIRMMSISICLAAPAVINGNFAIGARTWNLTPAKSQWQTNNNMLCVQ